MAVETIKELRIGDFTITVLRYDSEYITFADNLERHSYVDEHVVKVYKKGVEHITFYRDHILFGEYKKGTKVRMPFTRFSFTYEGYVYEVLMRYMSERTLYHLHVYRAETYEHIFSLYISYDPGKFSVLVEKPRR